MRLALPTILCAGLLTLLLVPLASAQGWDEALMIEYKSFQYTGDTVFAYAYSDLYYPWAYCPANQDDCWNAYSSYASVYISKNGQWQAFGESLSYNTYSEAYRFVSYPDSGDWALEAEHEVDVEWEDWYYQLWYYPAYDWLFDIQYDWLTIYPQPTVSISSASIPDDRITVELAPSGIWGTLMVQLFGGTTHTVYQSTEAGGTHNISFNIPNLPNSEFTGIQATWWAEGQSPSATYSYHFKVLGDYTHSQYNSPDEQRCSGTAQQFTYVTNMTCLAIDCGAATTQNANGRSQWLSEVNENGSGLHTTLGIVSRESQCTARAPYRNTGQPCPSCGGTLTPYQGVARNASNQDLPCNATVYVHGVGLRTVKDTGGGLVLTQLDHYIGVSGCDEASNYPPSKTIRLY